MAGLNMSVGLDYSQLIKDANSVDKRLTTLAGQERIMKITPFIENGKLDKDLMSSNKKVKTAASKLRDALSQLAKINPVMKEMYVNDKQINSMKKAQTAIRFINSELKKMEILNNKKEHVGWTDKDKANEYIRKLRTIKTWIDTIKNVSVGMGEYGFYDVDKQAINMKNARAKIAKDIKAMNADLAKVPVTDLTTREQMLKKLIDLQLKYNATMKHASVKAVAKVDNYREQLNAIKQQRQLNKENEAYASIKEKINNLEIRIKNSSSIKNKMAQIKEERAAVGGLITQWERYLSVARKANNSAEMNAAKSQLASLRQRHVELKNMEAEQRALTRSVNQNNAMFNEQGKILGRLRTLASRYISIFTIGHFGKKIIETTGYFDQQRVALEGIIGSAIKANELMNQIKDFALESPKTTKELISYVKQLSAFSIPTDELFETTRRLADLSTGLGVDMQRLILAYGQVRAAAVLRGQELRQFTEAGIPMVQALADKFSALRGELVSTGEVFELISKRQVSFDMVKSVMTDMTSEGGKFYKMQEQMVNTLYGQIQKLGDMWTLSLDKFGRSTYGFLNNIIKAAQWGATNFKSLLQGIIWMLGARGIGKAIAAAGVQFINMTNSGITGFRAMALEMKKLNNDVRDYRRLVRMATTDAERLEAQSLLATARMQRWAKLGSMIAAGFTAIGMAIGIVVSIIGIATRKTREFKERIEEIGRTVDRETEKAIDGVDSLVSKLRSAAEGTKEYNDAVSTLQSNYSQYIDANDTVINQLITMKEKYEELQTAIRNYGEYQKNQQKFDTVKENMMSSYSTGKLSWLMSAKNYRKYRKSSGLSKDALQEKYEDVERNLVEMMLDNGLSTSKDIATKWKEDRATFDNLVEEAFGIMKVSIGGNLVSPLDLMTDEEKSTFFQGLMMRINATDKRSEYEKYYKELNGSSNTIVSKYAFNEDAFTGYDVRKRIADIEIEKYINPKGEEVGNAQKYSEELVKIYADQLAKAIANALKDTGIEETKEYKDLMTKLEAVKENVTPDAVNSINSLANTLKKSIGDNDLKSIVDNANKLFRDNTEDVSGKSAAVRATMFQLFKPGTQEYEWMRQYLPNNANFNEIREGLPEKETSILNKLGHYGIDASKYNQKHKRYSIVEGGISDDYDQAEVDKLLQELTFIRTLRKGKVEGVSTGLTDKEGKEIQAQLFSVGAEVNKQNTGIGSRNIEFPDFFNYFKSAYDLYKKATQEGGTSAGLAKFRTDQTLIEMYGNLFGVNGQKDYGFTLGNVDINQIIDSKRIADGLETGVVDFKEAAQEIADKAKEYARQKPEERGPILKMAEQLQKWVTDTFTKDAVATWLKEVKQSAEDLRNEFNRTRNDVELYRAMIANGTETRLVGNIGTPGILGKSLAPDSQLVMSQIAKVIANGNNGLKELAAQDPNKTYQEFSIGDISTLSGIKTVRQQINNEENMNSEAFTALREGLISKEELTKLLDELERALTSELQSIKGERYSGNALQDAIANAKMAVNSQALQSAKDNINSFAKGFGLDEAAIKALADKLNTGGTDVFEKFLRENDFSAISNAGRYFGGRGIDMEKLGKKLDDLINELKNTNPGLANEIRMKKDDFVMKELEFRAKGGAFDAVAKNTKRYQNAGEIATQEFGAVNKQQTLATSQKMQLEMRRDELKSKGVSETDEQYTKVNIQLVEQEAILARCRERLDEMGGSAEKYEQIIKQAAVANIKAAIDAASNSLTSMTNAATSVLNAIKSLASMVNKMYDIFNDGENPEWMQDSEEILNDLGDAFEALIAPIAAVIAMLAACAVAAYALDIAFTPLLIVMLAIVAAAAIIAAIVVAAQQHDRNLEHDIESLKKSVTEFENAAKNLNAAAERMTGVDKMRTKVDALGKSLQSASAYSKMAEDEEAKKDTDDEKLSEYNQSAQEAKDEFLNGLKEMVDDITASTESWTDSLSSAIRSAFQNGENAARSFRDTVKTMIGDVVEEMIKMTIIEPLIQDALQTWTNSDALIAKYTSKGTGENGTDEFDSENYTKELLANIQDPQKTEAFYRSMLQIGTTTIDAINGLPTNLKDFYGYNSENSTLSGGIESITEDTARRIEALANSQLGELITIRTLLESYVSASKGYGNSTMASIQSAVTMINSNVGATKIATEAILKEIQQMRTTPANPLHVTMS